MTLSIKREDWVVKLLELCSTQTEVTTFLQTQLPPSSSIEANFGLAILDGHKKVVATQSYQQVVRQKWSKPTVAVPNTDEEDVKEEDEDEVHWNEMGSSQKCLHVVKEILVFFLIPMVIIISKLFPEKSQQLREVFNRNLNVPVNRFIHSETSKYLFVLLLFLTLVHFTTDKEFYLIDCLMMFWILSYINSEIRNFLRIWRSSPSKWRAVQRWATFRNIYTFLTNQTLFNGVILRFIGLLLGQWAELGAKGRKQAGIYWFYSLVLWGASYFSEADSRMFDVAPDWPSAD